jgi:16S rRNA processing protein RimM
LTTVSTAEWLPVALLLRPQGRRGELLAEPLTSLTTIFEAGPSVALVPEGVSAPPPDATMLTLEEHWFPTGKNAGRIVLKLSGCDSISAAELLAGHQILVRSAEVPALDPDTFFVGDLLGCDLFDGGLHVGRIVDVQFATGPDGRTRLEDAAPLLGVELLTSQPEAAKSPEDSDRSDPILVPFVRAWLDAVDLPNRRIVMHLPAGLLDEPASS